MAGPDFLALQGCSCVVHLIKGEEKSRSAVSPSHVPPRLWAGADVATETRIQSGGKEALRFLAAEGSIAH